MSGELAVRHILIVGQVPPPLGGQALQIEKLVAHDFDQVTTSFVPMNFSRDSANTGRVRLSKILQLFRVMWHVRNFCSRGRNVLLYYPPAPPRLIPVLRDIVLLSIVRPWFTSTIFHFHAAGLGEYLERHRVLGRISRCAYQFPDAAIVLDESLRVDAQALNAQIVQVIPYATKDPGEVVRESCDNATRPLVILFASIVAREKGVVDLIAASARLVQSGVNLRLVIAGPEGWDLPHRELIEIIAAHRMRALTDVLGPLDPLALQKYFRSSDVLCLPTTFFAEALPNVLIEGLSFGLPIIATRWRAIPSLVTNGINGFLTTPHSVSELAEAIEKLALDASLRETMCLQSRLKYLGKFDDTQYFSRIEALFLRVLDSARSKD